MSSEGRDRVLLVSSTGGHLDHLAVLQPWWSRYERMWVTFDKADARSLLGAEKVAWAYHPTTRNIPNMFRNFSVAWRTLRTFRPHVIVTTGAGVAFPFFVLAKAFRIKTVYLEVYDRMESPTLTGRLCRPLSDLFAVQWERQQQIYPHSVLIGELF